jgi:hypothetical protein
MPAVSPRQALPRMNSPARHCRAPGKALPLCWEGGEEGLSSLRGGKIASKGIPPSQDEVVYKRKLGTCPKGRYLQVRGGRILQGSPLSPPGSTHGGRAAEVHCGGLAGGIITMAGAVMIVASHLLKKADSYVKCYSLDH